jgi:hypothetical protein
MGQSPVTLHHIMTSKNRQNCMKKFVMTKTMMIGSTVQSQFTADWGIKYK